MYLLDFTGRGKILVIPRENCYNGKSRVLILDGNSEMGAHVLNGLGYLYCLRHLFRFGAVFFFHQK